jgi:flagellar motor protein MotB
MAEPQPSAVQEGAAEPHAPTGTADDRKAAAALSTLDTQEDNGVQKDVDGKALDKAVKRLSVKDTKADEKKNVKVEPADVNLLVRASAEQVAGSHADDEQMKELELNKQQATDLLKVYDGDCVKAMTAYVKGKA